MQLLRQFVNQSTVHRYFDNDGRAVVEHVVVRVAARNSPRLPSRTAGFRANDRLKVGGRRQRQHTKIRVAVSVDEKSHGCWMVAFTVAADVRRQSHGTISRRSTPLV